MQKTDEELAALVMSGDSEIFGELVERYEKRLLRYARKFLFGREDMEDLVQDVFLKAYQNIQSFSADKRFSPWIYRIAHNVFINKLKRRKFEPMNFFPDADTLFPHPVSSENADSESIREEVKKQINESMDAVGVKYKEVLVLHYFEEMSYKEISEVLEIPVSTVGVRIKRGKEKLKKFISNK